MPSSSFSDPPQPISAATATLPRNALSAMTMSPVGGISAQRTNPQLAGIVGGVLGGCAAIAIVTTTLFYFLLRKLRRRRMNRLPSYSSWGQLDPEMTDRGSITRRFSDNDYHIPRSPPRTLHPVRNNSGRSYNSRGSTLVRNDSSMSARSAMSRNDSNSRRYNPYGAPSPDFREVEWDRLQDRPGPVRQVSAPRAVRHPPTIWEERSRPVSILYEASAPSPRRGPRDPAGLGPWF
jgi:hypothetical protein